MLVWARDAFVILVCQVLQCVLLVTSYVLDRVDGARGCCFESNTIDVVLSWELLWIGQYCK